MSYIAKSWRRLPYYAQFFGSIAVMTAAILLTTIHSVSGGGASRTINFLICLGSFILGRAAFPDTDNEKESDLRYKSWYFLLVEHAMIVLILYVYEWDIGEVCYFLNKVGKMRTLMALAIMLAVSVAFFIAAEVAKRKEKR